MIDALNSRQKTIFILKIAAPYFAVIIGLYVFHNAWLSIFLYHGQIIFWWLIDKTTEHKELILQPNTTNYLNLPNFIERILKIASKTMLPISALAGIACYFLLPFIVKDVSSLSDWLIQKRLSGNALLLLIPYFGIIHPLIEQRHWQPLTKLPGPYNYVSHISFAVYHGLVLYPILQPFWIIVCIVILSSISFLWSYVRQQKLGNLLKGHHLSYFSHVLADIGIVTATFLLVKGL